MVHSVFIVVCMFISVLTGRTLTNSQLVGCVSMRSAVARNWVFIDMHAIVLLP